VGGEFKIKQAEVADMPLAMVHAEATRRFVPSRVVQLAFSRVMQLVVRESCSSRVMQLVFFAFRTVQRSLHSCVISSCEAPVKANEKRATQSNMTMIRID